MGVSGPQVIEGCAIASGELLRLVLHDEQFSWLRVLSAMIADIDAMADADEPIEHESIRNVFREAHRLLKFGGTGDFQDRYAVALQESPDVVLAHADVSRVLPASTAAPGNP